MRTDAPRNLLRCAAHCWLLLVLALGSACQSGAAAPPVATGATAASTAAPTGAPQVERQPIPNGPVLLGAGITLRNLTDVTAGSIKLAQNPADGDLYYLTTGNGIYHVAQSQASARPEQIASAAEVGPGASATGMAISLDGVFYVVADQRIGTNQNQATIRRGTAGSGGYHWEVVATTAPYPLSDTPFDHMVNGIVLSPDGKWLYVNSGSRTDHGEVEDNKGAFPDTREVGLTAKIFRIPSDAKELMLPNDDAALTAQGYIFARGTRNAYDMAFAPNGDLFAVDNGPDADYPDELNWIREGQHYGFPWQFGSQDNPQQFPTYDSKADKRLRDDFTAVKIGAYHTDPGFPKPAVAFSAPVRNLGPAAALNRADDGSQYDAIAKDAALTTFTPHRSPLGLVFPTDPSVPAALRGSGDATGAFVLSWGAAGGTLTDKGQDLLHLLLRKNGDNYEAVITQVARGFSHPIDAVMLANRLYVLENGENPKLWELTFT